MGNNLIKIYYRKLVVPVVILALSFISFATREVNQASAAYDVVTKSKSIDRFGDITVEMINGSIIVTAKSKAAGDTTLIRYQTIGFGVSKSEQTRTVKTKGYTGPAAPENIGTIWLNDNNRISSDTVEGWNVSVFQFSAEKVNSILNGELDEITNNTIIYLNAVFQSYHLNSDGSKTILKGQGGGITSWQEMMNAEAWSEDSLEGFAKYYNRKIEFAPGPQPIKLYNDYNGDVQLERNLGDKNINSSISLEDLSEYKATYKGNNYILTGYKIEPYLNREVIKGNGPSQWTTPNDDETTVINYINARSFYVPLGGFKIIMKYKPFVSQSYKSNLYYLKKGITKGPITLATHKAGEKLSWKTEAKNNPITDEKYFGPGDYELLGYEIRSADGTKTYLSRYKALESGTVTDADLLDDNVEVKAGGLRVYLVYSNKGDNPVIPTPTPKPGATPTPVPEIPPLDIPVGDYQNKPLDSMDTVGIIRADLRGSERFNAPLGIPTTESLYAQVQGSEYNVGYIFTKKVVIKDYPIKVSKTYNLSWTDAKDKTKIITDTVVISQTVTVRRACAYWEIEKFDYYTFHRATVYNKALPDGVSVMYPNASYYSTPGLIINHYSNESYHIIPPGEATSGLVLPPESLAGGGTKPTVPVQDFTYDANIKTGQIKVRNDYLSFDGSVVMENSIHVKQTDSLTNLFVLNRIPNLSNQNTFYKPNQIIEAILLNDIYPSHGTLTYTNSPSAVASSGNTYEIPIQGLNSVTVHTPVICDASITTNNPTTNITSNNKYVQALNVDEDCIQLVLDPDDRLSDFTVDIDNYGKHLSLPGYYTRDFAWGIRDPGVSYLAKKNDIYRNEVKFPFDVFYRKSGEDEYIPKNTWMRIGHSTPTFYLPMWVDEGNYTVALRTIAVNGVNTESQLSKTQTYANSDRENYVATDTVRVQVSGRIYGLTLYDVTDYPTWETVFRASKGSAILKMNEGYPSGINMDRFNTGYFYNYTVGTSNQYGIATGRLGKYTLPLVNGSHPNITNVGVLRTGYAVKFKLTTTGNAYSSGDSVVIKPKFYYVDGEGKNRQEVDIYYTENFKGKSHNLVKMGSALDLTNIKKYRCGEQFFSMPKVELQIMADLRKIALSKYLWEDTDLFSYTSIRIHSPLMTYVNTDYLRSIKTGTQYEAIKAAGVKDVDIVKRMQSFYGEYFIPANVKAVKKGFDVYGYASKYGVKENEAFWLTGGYIIINFDIVTEDSDGNKNLSYVNKTNATKGYCSMWNMENPVSTKQSYNGKKKKSTVFDFLPGDFMVYFTDLSLKDDYVTYIIN
ncbi:MAG: putative secreted protein [Herbinix sp.]|jgi:hypothetical protein|nr:putative secreted protein [Herbinix sp.]